MTAATAAGEAAAGSSDGTTLDWFRGGAMDWDYRGYLLVFARWLWRVTLGGWLFGAEDPETGESSVGFRAWGWIVGLVLCVVFAVVGYVVTHHAAR